MQFLVKGIELGENGVFVTFEETPSDLRRNMLSLGWDCSRLEEEKKLAFVDASPRPEEERIEKSFTPLRDLVSSVHLHDNHGDKDEHLPPFDGTIDWPEAIKLLKSAPDANLPLVLELKEKTGPEAPSAAEHLAAARNAMDRFEEEWD